MNVLLTGFEPWGSNAVNPSGEVARELGGSILPVDFRKADRALRLLLKRQKPDALVMLGLAEKRKHINLEAVALNVDHHEEAGVNKVFLRTIDPAGPLALRTRLPLPVLRRKLKAIGVPAVVSYHAGTFLCNHVFYRGLRETTGPCGFIHLPPFRVLPRAAMIQAVRTILHAVAGWSPATTP